MPHLSRSCSSFSRQVRLVICLLHSKLNSRRRCVLWNGVAVVHTWVESVLATGTRLAESRCSLLLSISLWVEILHLSCLKTPVLFTLSINTLNKIVNFCDDVIFLKRIRFCLAAYAAGQIISPTMAHSMTSKKWKLCNVYTAHHCPPSQRSLSSKY